MIARMLRTPFLSLSKSQIPLSSLQILLGSHGRSGTKVTDIFRDPTGISSNRISIYGFRTFCTGTDKDLLTKKCVPCNSKDLQPMTEESASKLVPKADGWNLVNEEGTLKLKRSWKVKSFSKGLEMFQLISDIAEAEGHHPDLHLVGWNNVTVEIWTHAIGGLTENDFILAAKINALDLHQLERRFLLDRYPWNVKLYAPMDMFFRFVKLTSRKQLCSSPSFSSFFPRMFLLKVCNVAG